MKLSLKLSVVALALSTAFAQSQISVNTAPPVSSPSSASVQAGQPPNTLKRPTILNQPPNIKIDAKAWTLMDYQTGKILTSANETEEFPPASLTKLVTAYVVFNSIHQGHIHLDDMVTISKEAAQTPGSKMFLKAKEQVSVENLLKGMIITSGNDAAVALAEHVAGTQQAFVQLMNNTALQLGMNHSHFATASGLPAKDQYTSALDIARLSRALIAHFPREYRLFSEKQFTWNGITQKSRNPLLHRDPSVDGLITGYTEKAKYCLVVSSHREGMRLISIVLGAPNLHAREDDSERLLNYGFRFFQNHLLYPAEQVIGQIPVENGKSHTVNYGVLNDAFVTLPRGHLESLSVQLTAPKYLQAPVKLHQQVGAISVSSANGEVASIPVYALQAIQKGSLWHKVKGWFS